MAKNHPEPAETDKLYCCACPYCDVDLERLLPLCRTCGSQLRYCSQCGHPVKKEDLVCPNCGATRVVREGD